MNKINHISYYYVVKPNSNLKNEKEHTPAPLKRGMTKICYFFTHYIFS